MENRVFNIFKLAELFDVKSSKKKFNAKDIKISNTGHPYVARSSENNGIRGYIDEHEIYLNEGNTISFGQDTATIFYQKLPYFTGDKIKILHPKSERFNEKNAQYIISVLNKAFSNFSWGSGSFNVNILNNVSFELPVIDQFKNEPDWVFMENNCRKIKKNFLKKIDNYLKEKGYTSGKDTLITKTQLQTIEQHKNSQFIEVPIKSIFNIFTGKDFIMKDSEDGKIPVISRSSEDNGFGMFSAPVPNQKIFDHNHTITATLIGKIWSTIQNQNFYIGTRVKALVAKDKNMSKRSLQYITVAINKVGQTYVTYQNKPRDFEELSIMLPISETGDINYQLMDNYIEIVEKNVLRKLRCSMDDELVREK
jgi:hypothetical protein